MTEQQVFQLTFYETLRRHFVRFGVKTMIRILSRVKIEGLENVPKGGAYVVAFNHVSLLEPPLVVCFWPKVVEMLSGEVVFNRPGVGLIARGYKALPVRRGKYDRKAMDIMVVILKSGRSLAIAPEGGRSKTPGMMRAQAGIAYIVDLTNVPIVPVAVEGARDEAIKDAFKLKRPRFSVFIGKSFTLPPIEGKGQARRDSRQGNADHIMIQIAKMLPEEYHGVYAGQVTGAAPKE